MTEVPEMAGSLDIEDEDDVVTARMAARETASDLGFELTDTTRIVTAVSELARNVYRYAGSGTMYWRVCRDGDRDLLEIGFDDDGPGIGDVDMALREGESSSKGMGQGLPGARKLMDEFDVETGPTSGTTVTIGKYLP